MEIQDKKLIVECPEGYTIDKENSTFERIKFKPIVKRWRDDEYAELNGFYVHSGDSEVKKIEKSRNVYNCKCIFATEKQAKSALAMAQISQIMANDERFGGVVKELDFGNTCAKRFWQIQRIKLKSEKPYIAINQVDASYDYSVLTFYKLEQAVLFLEENEDLVKDYLMID